MTYKIVIYWLDDRATQIVAAEDLSLSNARVLARMMCGKGWQMERRPDLHTYGSLVMAVVKQGDLVHEVDRDDPLAGYSCPPLLGERS